MNTQDIVSATQLFLKDIISVAVKLAVKLGIVVATNMTAVVTLCTNIVTAVIGIILFVFTINDYYNAMGSLRDVMNICYSLYRRLAKLNRKIDVNVILDTHLTNIISVIDSSLKDMISYLQTSKDNITLDKKYFLPSDFNSMILSENIMSWIDMNETIMTARNGTLQSYIKFVPIMDYIDTHEVIEKDNTRIQSFILDNNIEMMNIFVLKLGQLKESLNNYEKQYTNLTEFTKKDIAFLKTSVNNLLNLFSADLLNNLKLENQSVTKDTVSIFNSIYKYLDYGSVMQNSPAINFQSITQLYFPQINLKDYCYNIPEYPIFVLKNWFSVFGDILFNNIYIENYKKQLSFEYQKNQNIYDKNLYSDIMLRTENLNLFTEKYQDGKFLLEFFKKIKDKTFFNEIIKENFYLYKDDDAGNLTLQNAFTSINTEKNLNRFYPYINDYILKLKDSYYNKSDTFKYLFDNLILNDLKMSEYFQFIKTGQQTNYGYLQISENKDLQSFRYSFITGDSLSTFNDPIFYNYLLTLDTFTKCSLIMKYINIGDRIDYPSRTPNGYDGNIINNIVVACKNNQMNPQDYKDLISKYGLKYQKVDTDGNWWYISDYRIVMTAEDIEFNFKQVYKYFIKEQSYNNYKNYINVIDTNIKIIDDYLSQLENYMSECKKVHYDYLSALSTSKISKDNSYLVDIFGECLNLIWSNLGYTDTINMSKSVYKILNDNNNFDFRIENIIYPLQIIREAFKNSSMSDLFYLINQVNMDILFGYGNEKFSAKLTSFNILKQLLPVRYEINVEYKNNLKIIEDEINNLKNNFDKDKFLEIVNQEALEKEIMTNVKISVQEPVIIKDPQEKENEIITIEEIPPATVLPIDTNLENKLVDDSVKNENTVIDKSNLLKYIVISSGVIVFLNMLKGRRKNGKK